ncbi:L,D-transpeptidase [Lactobacillus sp. Sy-1]|uniref:L,D-transpeptidase n=1 Tax=Lactobacillus sp. Sy-1 TaxID=2109645 RepID=UPI001C57D836|nr:L,D-transpeptidase [Lactobacillus sp. Sy-1]MBW1604928.1 L,D-transpeptidase [Lactobacillus sp. Sy-1]
MKKRLLMIPILALLVLAGCSNSSQQTSQQSSSQKITKVAKSKTSSSANTSSESKSTADRQINWHRPSESKPYPNMKLSNHNWLKVSIKQQRVFVMSPKNQVLYTMNASTGANNSTPRGTYHIQAERGTFFYNKSSKEGARYWTSWKDHGIYLFHTVPTNAKGKYIKSEAEQLGKTANSHGCIRLSIPDAKWINQNVPTGTKVVIK